VRFEHLTAVNIDFFLRVVPCALGEMYRILFATSRLSKLVTKWKLQYSQKYLYISITLRNVTSQRIEVFSYDD